MKYIVIIFIGFILNLLFILWLIHLASCSAKIEAPKVLIETPNITKESEEAPEPSKYDLGKKVFQQRCMGCHVNPKTGGSLCPPNYGSSLELLRLKVLEGKYPNSYKSKKTTKIMPRFPYLSKDIENLFEYLNN